MPFLLIMAVFNDYDVTEMTGRATLFDVRFRRDPNTSKSFLSVLVNEILTSEAMKRVPEILSFISCKLRYF